MLRNNADARRCSYFELGLPVVLVALIQCATMATEVVEVATESEEDVKINCVAIFYEEGKEGENFRRAVRFNNRLLH